MLDCDECVKKEASKERIGGRERSPAVMRFQKRTETRARRGFTIDFTSYEVLIITLSLKSPVCFRSHTKTILIEVCLRLNKYDKKKVAIKKQHDRLK